MDSFRTIRELLDFIVEHHDKPDLLNYRKDNAWVPIATAEFARSVSRLAGGLISLGLKRGEHVGIISNPSPFWLMADLAICLAGGVSVAIFRRISPENLEFEIADAGLGTIFIGDPNEFDPVRQNGGQVSRLITMGFERDDPNSLSFEELMRHGDRWQEQSGKADNGFARPAESDLFTMLYTSGSMGRPKGVMLTHWNIISQIHAATQIFDIDKSRDFALSSLPLSHIFERMVMYFYLSRGLSIYFVDAVENIGTYIRELRPTIMTVVPMLLERVYDRMKLKVEEESGLKRTIGLAAMRRAASRPETQKHRSLADMLYQRLVYRKFQEALGGRFNFVITGSAALPAEIGRFFLNIGLPLFEGYGMTEASPVIAANYPGHRKLGTVGPVFPGVTVKFGPDGEILAQGPNIMLGYHNNPGETAQTIDPEGWLHTGDLGQLDADGFLKITGRKKELFKKSTGEYVPPVPIEQALTRLDIVGTAVVIAENRKSVGCLLFPDMEAVERLRQKEGHDYQTAEDFLKSDFVKQRIKDHIREVNKHLHHTEEVMRFRIVTAPLSIETGELTPTMKIRRGVVEQKFKQEIDSMYMEKS